MTTTLKPLHTYLCYRLPGDDRVAVLSIRSRNDYDTASPEAIDPHEVRASCPSAARVQYRAAYRHFYESGSRVKTGHYWATVTCERCGKRTKCRNVELFKGVATLCGPDARAMEQLPITRRCIHNLDLALTGQS